MGVAGSIVLFIGDMLLYGRFGSAGGFTDALQAAAGNASETRLFIGGMLGPAGAMLVIPGFWHIHLNTRRNSRSLSAVVFISLTCMMLFGGAFHALWTIRMLLLKHALPSAAGASPFIGSYNRYLNSIFAVALSIGSIGGALLIVMILFHKTIYPRWMVLVNPGLLLLLTPLVRRIPRPLGSIIYGGYLNIIFIVFFTASVIVSWKLKAEIAESNP
jgi:hypothetical protein